MRECFGVEPDAWQVDALAAYPSSKRLAMKAAKGPGKTTVLAWLLWNFLLTRPNANVSSGLNAEMRMPAAVLHIQAVEALAAATAFHAWVRRREPFGP